MHGGKAIVAAVDICLAPRHGQNRSQPANADHNTHSTQSGMYTHGHNSPLQCWATPRPDDRLTSRPRLLSGGLNGPPARTENVDPCCEEYHRRQRDQQLANLIISAATRRFSAVSVGLQSLRNFPRSILSFESGRWSPYCGISVREIPTWKRLVYPLPRRCNVHYRAEWEQQQKYDSQSRMVRINRLAVE